MHTALEELRVIELSGGIAGSYCTKLLADFGADVLKVEPPEGDHLRQRGPFPQDTPHPEASGLFLYLNTNKKGVTLNLEHATGRDYFRRLLSHYDCLVEACPPEKLDAWGLDYSALAAINPRLLHISITPFGRTGPYSTFADGDLICWALSTGLWTSGPPGKPPLRSGRDISEYCSAVWAAAILLGLHHGRQASGRGQHVDLSAIESMITLQPYHTLTYAYTGSLMSRRSNTFPLSVARCKDGYVGYALLREHMWESMCRLAGRPDILEDQRFKDPRARRDYTQELEAAVAPWFAERTVEAAVREAQKLRVAVTPVNSPQALLESRHLSERQFFTDVGNALTGPLEAPGAPFRLPASPWRLQQPAPKLGQHNREVYCGALGLADKLLQDLKETGVV